MNGFVQEQWSDPIFGHMYVGSYNSVIPAGAANANFDYNNYDFSKYK